MRRLEIAADVLYKAWGVGMFQNSSLNVRVNWRHDV